jgi:RimJ/RimL family protein N-acetyltransferase
MALQDQIIVRPAREEDVESIVSFSAAMALETEGRQLDMPRLREGTLALIKTPDRGFFMVAALQQESSQPILGQLMITFEWSDWRNAAFWWIQSVYVDPAWRRQGVYRRMHHSIMQLAQSRPDVCGVRLYVEETNTAARQVYSRVGLSISRYQIYETDFVLPRTLDRHV